MRLSHYGRDARDVSMNASMARAWHIGLRFTRALRLLSTPDVLQYLNLLKSSNEIRATQLVSKLLSVWFAGAGFVHLVSRCYRHCRLQRRLAASDVIVLFLLCDYLMIYDVCDL